MMPGGGRPQQAAAAAVAEVSTALRKPCLYLGALSIIIHTDVL